MACPFCRIVADVRHAVTPVLDTSGPAIVLVPLRPVVAGHLLVVSKQHADHAADDPQVAADAMFCAAQYARSRGGAWNILTSIGAEATQTVPHLHLHLVPRRHGDGVVLPWTGQGRDAS